MSQQNILFAILIIGALLSFASTIWAIVSEKFADAAKPADEDQSASAANQPTGLSRKGQVSIALALGSALIATTALGLKELIDRQKATAAVTAEAERKGDRRREIADGQRWDRFRDQQLKQQQDLLSGIERREAERHAADILGSQRLIAAVEAQRDEAIAVGARRLQLDQSRRIQQAQPLHSLVVQLTFGGFSAAEFAELTAGADHVATAGDRDDEVGRMIDALPEILAAGMLLYVISPAVAAMADASSDIERGQHSEDRVLILDLGGEGAWLLPLGITHQEEARGFILRRHWLYESTNPNGNPGPGQALSPCLLPAVELDRGRRVVIVTWSIPSDCLPLAVHLPGNVSPTARLTDTPRIAIFRGAPPFPSTAINVTRIDRRVSQRCWDLASGNAGSHYAELVAVPNANPSIAVRKRLEHRGRSDVSFRVSSYDEAQNYGVCSLFT